MAYAVEEFSDDAVIELLDAQKEEVEKDDDEAYWREYGSQLLAIRRHCDKLIIKVEEKIDELSTAEDDDEQEEGSGD